MFWIASWHNGNHVINQVYAILDIDCLPTPDGWRIERLEVHIDATANSG